MERFRELVTGRYLAAEGPLNLATLAQDVRNELQGAQEKGNWLGLGGFGRALRWLDLSGLTSSQHYIWDKDRHAAPTSNGLVLPTPVDKVTNVLTVPRLPSDVWPAVYAGLASYAAGHHFNLTKRLAGRAINWQGAE